MSSADPLDREGEHQPPRVRFRLPSITSPAGNAYAILGLWTRAARAAGWTQEQIDATLRQAKSSDYDHLRAVIRSTTVKR